MRKAAIVLIIIGIVVVIGANLFIGSQEETLTERMQDPSTLRGTESGDVVGFRDQHGARAWLGIPYAQPPVDDLRWRAPRPPQTSDTQLSALSLGNVCPQFSSILTRGEQADASAMVGDEDCLYLNIWSPPNAADLPVMVWVHGGSNTAGHGGTYNGSALAAKQDVVVVTINYRLGFFGWFNHPKLHTGDLASDSGNYGTLDIIRALEWVRDNVEVFGGDPDNVTLFGESAGAYNTLALMASPLAKDLFHRAVVQSGSYRAHPLSYAQNTTEQGGHVGSSAEIVAKLILRERLADDLAGAKEYAEQMSPTELRTLLSETETTEFFALFASGDGEFGSLDLPTGIADGHVLPLDDAATIFGDLDRHNAVPVILGTNRDEPSSFMVLNPAYVTNWLGFLPRIKEPENYARMVYYGGLEWAERGVDSLAILMRNAGNPHVYAYRFDWDEEPSQFGFDVSKALGAGHGLEIDFIFDQLGQGVTPAMVFPNDEAQFALATAMSNYWATFARDGDPGAGTIEGLPRWTPWGEAGQHRMIFDSTNDAGIRMANGIITPESMLAEFIEDTGFGSEQVQCETYVRTFPTSFDVDVYNGLNSTCASLDPESIGWY